MNNLSKAKISLIKSLSIKKYRNEHRLFIIEGRKSVEEVLGSELKTKHLIHTDKWKPATKYPNIEIYNVTENEIKGISNLKTPPSVIAISEIPEKELSIKSLKDKLTLTIDDIQDPGNLGTIIRICDWFGIENIICSLNSADVFNPKVIQATMGAFTRVNVFYKELCNFIKEYKELTHNKCYGTFLEGENVYKACLSTNGLIILGNEGQGISKEIGDIVDQKIFIPPYSTSKEHVESLNISTAAAIICSEFRKAKYI